MVLDQVDPRMHRRLAVALAGDIISGRLARDSIFPTGDQLTEAHGVSRTVVRETLQALASAGLINVQHGKRTTVNGIDDWRFLDPLVQQAMQSERLPEKLLRDLYDTRLLIEVETARLCATRATPELRDRLHSSIDAFRDLAAGIEEYGTAFPSVIALDRDFHATIAEGSGNVVLARIERDAHRGLMRTWEPDRFDKTLLETIRRQHLKVARAIDGRDADEAAAAMRRHIQWSLKDTLQARAKVVAR